MTNPDNSVGTNAAYGGRTSVNAFNDDLAGYARGIMSGWECQPNSGLTVSLGGSGSVRDVAVAEDNAGNKTTINNISGTPVDVTMSAAPGTNSRIDAIVAYVDNPPQGSSTIADNYEACGLITVQGTAAANPVAPNDSAIRTAITADGASGTTAYYAVLAYVTIASGTTDITGDMIAPGGSAFSGLSTTCGVDFYNATIGSSVSFIADQDMIVEVEALTGYVWGYAGGIVSLDVSTHTGLTQIFHRAGGITGGDSVGRQMGLHALYSTTSGTSCTIKVEQGGNTGGSQTGSNVFIVKCYRLGNKKN